MGLLVPVFFFAILRSTMASLWTSLSFSSASAVFMACNPVFTDSVAAAAAASAPLPALQSTRRDAACPDNRYLHEGRCCERCVPGHFVEAHCTASTQTRCRVCPGGFFLEVPSGRDGCFRCQHCDPVDGLDEAVGCSPVSDARCRCRAGTFCSYPSGGGSCLACHPHSACRAGTQLLLNGSETADVECVPCDPGMFSPGGNSRCKPHTNCSSAGHTLLLEGSALSDARCVELPQPQCPESDAPWMSNTIMFAVCMGAATVSVVSMAMAVTLVIRQRSRRWSPCRHVETAVLAESGSQSTGKRGVARLWYPDDPPGGGATDTEDWRSELAADRNRLSAPSQVPTSSGSSTSLIKSARFPLEERGRALEAHSHESLPSLPC